MKLSRFGAPALSWLALNTYGLAGDAIPAEASDK